MRGPHHNNRSAKGIGGPVEEGAGLRTARVARITIEFDVPETVVEAPGDEPVSGTVRPGARAFTGHVELIAALEALRVGRRRQRAARTDIPG